MITWIPFIVLYILGGYLGLMESKTTYSYVWDRVVTFLLWWLIPVFDVITGIINLFRGRGWDD